MNDITIYELDKYNVNDRNGSYTGEAGSKEGIDINGEPWIVKYPKSTAGMRGDLASYTSSPLSEYIGSHIYNIVGIDVHETILGIRNNKVVVGCKDFCKAEGSLREIRALKNVYNETLSEMLERSMSATGDNHLVDIDKLLIHIDYNPILSNVPDIKDRFWQQALVDLFINNNDRNNGNWGVLKENGEYRLAPVYDNGAAFSTKLPDRKLEQLLLNPERMAQSLDATKTVYSRNGETIYAKDVISIENDDMYRVAVDIIPQIQERMDNIKSFINAIPERYGDKEVCSPIKKAYYINCLEARLERFLLPILDKAKNQEKAKPKAIKPKKRSTDFER